MIDVFAPLAAAALIWWLSTGVLLWLVGTSRKTRAISAIILTGLAAAATVMVYQLGDVTRVSAAYAGFATGILLWAWHEAMFLFGYISGPRKTPCPPGLSGWKKFKVSAETLIVHELVIAGHAGLIVALSFGAANQVAAMTFLLLWGMRLSSKMVIFFGAPNVSAQFLPPHLTYLATYFNTSRATRFFPIFLIVISSVAATLVYFGVTLPGGSFEATVYLLLATLAGLAVFEHCALVLPLPDAELWSWAQNSNKKSEPTPPKEELDFGRT
jgi:putative photosynthetic complex assembly protein 2